MMAGMPTPLVNAPWSVVVPVKAGPLAKSRLAVPSPAATRLALALAMARDTLAAVIGCVGAPRTYVVTAAPHLVEQLAGPGARHVPDPGAGLDRAVQAGVAAVAAAAVAAEPAGPVAVLLADLPAVRAEDVAAALEAAAAYPRAFVPDRQGTGTVLLAAGDPRLLSPAFGAGSAARHSAQGHVIVGAGLERLRADVDTLEDLRHAQDLGLGAATREALRSTHAG